MSRMLTPCCDDKGNDVMSELARYGKRESEPFMEKSALVLEGPLAVREQEGGYASPSVQVNGEDVTTAIADMFRDLMRLESDNVKPPGRWLLTLEKLDE